MKTHAVICVFLVVALAACAREAPEQTNDIQAPLEVVESTETPTDAPAVVETPPEEPAAAPALDEATIKAADASMRSVDRIGVYPAFKKVNPGDELVIAVGIANRLAKTETFKVQATYKSAKDKYMGSLSEDQQFASSWVAGNEFETIEVAPTQKEFVPMNIRIGKTRDGFDPKPGTYTFDIDILVRSSLGDFDDYATKQLVVVVEEPAAE